MTVMPLTWKGIDRHELERAGVERRASVVQIPYRYPDGSDYATRMFGRDRSWWKGIDDRGLIPFGLETLASRQAAASLALLLCEGESDSLVARQHLGGAFDVLGVPGAHSWQRTWAGWAMRYPTVYPCGDGDGPGRELNFAVLRDVPHARPVHLPDGRDVRSVLQQQDGRLAFEALIAQADAEGAYWTAFEEASDLADLRHRLGAA